MAEFASYYVEFLQMFFKNLGQFFVTIGSAFYKGFGSDFIDYFKLLGDNLSNFDVFGWILLVLISAINLCLIFFLAYRLVQLLRRYIFFRAKEVDKDKLMEEIAKLKEQAQELTQDKNRIFALKVGSDVFDGESIKNNVMQTSNVSVSPSQQEKVKEISKGKSRFTKLANLDEYYAENPQYLFMEDKDMISLPEAVDKFINFAASQLKLYYKPSKIREFLAGMATSKIIILEGISGTGKTSLPYGFSKFVNNNVSICSVQPSWRDRAELIGYFNEFTKKFNETDFLSSLYEASLREDPRFIVLDEMNLARIEYYFADFLSIMEMPDIAEWKIDLISEPLPSDPKNIVYGKLLVPQNVWFIGTANNDDSTFTITDKVYDRAVAISLNEKANYFDAPLTDTWNVSASYIESLFEKARETYSISEENLKKITELDAFIQQKFKIGFGNRIMKQIKLFVPAYIGCGGTEIEALDFMINTKILRKFASLNLPFLTKELSELLVFLDKKYGKGSFKQSIAYINELQKQN